MLVRVNQGNETELLSFDKLKNNGDGIYSIVNSPNVYMLVLAGKIFYVDVCIELACRNVWSKDKFKLLPNATLTMVW